MIGYTFPEVRKAAMSFAIFALTTLAVVVAYDPGIKDAIIVALGNAFAVAAVFYAPKFSVDDLTKMLGQLVGSVQSLLAFFFVIDPNVWVVVGAIVALIPIGYAVWKTKNLEPINMLTPPPEFFERPPSGIQASSVTAEKLAHEAITTEKIAPGTKPPPGGPGDGHGQPDGE